MAAIRVPVPPVAAASFAIIAMQILKNKKCKANNGDVGGVDICFNNGCSMGIDL